MKPIWPSSKWSVFGLLRTDPIAPTSVASRPSMIQVMPRAITTRQCQAPQGSRSIRAGMSVVIDAAGPVEEIALMGMDSSGEG